MVKMPVGINDIFHWSDAKTIESPLVPGPGRRNESVHDELCDAAPALSELEQAIRRARLAADGKTGLLRIGFISTAGREIVPGIRSSV
jgi:hypothetical protein